jgi:site-specific DNA recombinase
MTTAAIYCRISLDLEGRGLGVQRQESECRELAEKFGHDVGNVFVDNDLSAYTGKPRPAWDDLTSRIRLGEFDVLVAWHPDRLTRHPLQLEALVDLLEATKTIVLTVSAGEYDLGTATGRMCARVVGAVARHESERTSERLRSMARQHALTGAAWGRGRRAFGFEWNGVDHRLDEVKALRWAARQVLAGRTMVWIANRMPLPSVYGMGRWNPESLRRMLKAPRLVGLREYKGTVVATGNWKPVLDRATWDALRGLLVARQRPHAPPQRYLLSGLAVDSKGSLFYGRTTPDGIRRYDTNKTPDGHGCCIRADALDAIVVTALREQQRVPQATRRWIPDWDDLNLTQRRSTIREAFESILVLPSIDEQRTRRQVGDRVVITSR